MKNKNKLFLCSLAIMLIGGTITSIQAKEVKETIEKTLSFATTSKARQLVVDNINGAIDVTGYAGSEVIVKIEKTISARSDAKLEEAREKIQLEIREESDAIILYVDAPYRRPDGSINHRGWRYYGYDVTFDYQIKVPRKVNMVLKTINGGEINVHNTEGDFEIDNINGGVEAIDINGSGRIYALNGDVTIEFTRNPAAECSFGSLNGEINITFLPNLSADFRIKTFNGEVYTDFDVTQLNARPAIQKHKRGKYVYESDKAFGARVGSGGPEIEIDGFNGDIYIAKK